MKKILIILFLISLNTVTFAASINPVAYRQMQLQQYQRSRYQQQQRTRKIPYWQAQSNYTTRNRSYNNYGNTNYNYSQSSGSNNYYRRQW